MATDNPERMITPMPTRLLERIDDYRFASRSPTRAAAVRDLLDKALTAVGIPAKRRALSKGRSTEEAAE